MNATDDSESLHATCPGCGRTVRIPASRLQDNPRCPSCRSGIFLGAPVIEEAARAFASHVIVAKVNSDEAPAVSQRFQIRGIPTVALFKHGREIGRQTGALPSGALSQWLSTLGVSIPPGR